MNNNFSEIVWKKEPKPTISQPVMLIEEMAELQKEMTKLLRGKGDWDHIVEEIADVEVLLDSIKYGYQISEQDIQKVKSEKMNRYLISMR